MHVQYTYACMFLGFAEKSLILEIRQSPVQTQPTKTAFFTLEEATRPRDSNWLMLVQTGVIIDLKDKHKSTCPLHVIMHIFAAL